MSFFKKCILTSQEASLYLNPLSDSTEHSIPSSDPTSSIPCEPSHSSLTSIFSFSSYSSSCSSLGSSWRSSNDQGESSFAASRRRFTKSTETPSRKLDGQAVPGQELRVSKGKQKLQAPYIGKTYKKESSHLLLGDLVHKRDVTYDAEVSGMHGVEERITQDEESVQKAPLFPPATPTLLSYKWDDPECEVAPASSWSTLGNRTLLCRPLPLDVGCCVCYIKKERYDGTSCYALYTDEGHGRQDRRLALAVHKRPAGRSEYVVYPAGMDSSIKVEAILGKVRANLVGSRYSIIDNSETMLPGSSSSSNLLGVIVFEPTVSSFTGTYRVMRAFIPKYQSTQITPFIHKEKFGLALDWEENPNCVHTLYSRKPHYNKMTRCYELDFRDRTKRSSKIKTSVKNMLLTMNENRKQAILIFGKVGKSMYLLEYRFPLTAYQAFSICLSSLDTKVCCSI